VSLNAVFEALSHPVRRDILALLRRGPLSAGALAGHFELSKPTLSAHFGKLKEAGLVTVERQGTSLIYHLNMSILEEALSGFLAFREPRA
jgi:DNA-binding transcriptional ArsR family regulator